MSWLKKRSELQKLKENYSKLMSRSYELALTNKPESDRVNQQARDIYERIKRFENGDRL